MKRLKHVKAIIFLVSISLIYIGVSYFKSPVKVETPAPVIETALYTGKIYHAFFHSLIIYPQLAFHGDADIQGYKDYMITQYEFKKILPQLHANNFVLIDPHLLYTNNPDGTITKKELYIPLGKKPLILSLDDVNYYKEKRAYGFANKLVLDAGGNIATEVTNPEGITSITRDGDTIPLIDDFIKVHPDFSWKDAKGIIALTGYQGILGYARSDERVHPIVKKLKETGWIFGSHSYTHKMPFRDDSISLTELTRDTELWDTNIRPLVGDTDIFVGPFGQVFKPYDERRNYLVSKGFKLLFGVGMDLYLEYFPNYIMEDRANIDGIRLTQTPSLLLEYFNPEEVLDPERNIRK